MCVVLSVLFNCIKLNKPHTEYNNVVKRKRILKLPNTSSLLNITTGRFLRSFCVASLSVCSWWIKFLLCKCHVSRTALLPLRTTQFCYHREQVPLSGSLPQFPGEVCVTLVCAPGFSLVFQAETQPPGFQKGEPDSLPHRQSVYATEACLVS